jgi:hypothetical protein
MERGGNEVGFELDLEFKTSPPDNINDVKSQNTRGDHFLSRRIRGDGVQSHPEM